MESKAVFFFRGSGWYGNPGVKWRPVALSKNHPSWKKREKTEGLGIHILPNVQNPGWLFDIGDELLPNYMGIINNANIRIP